MTGRLYIGIDIGTSSVCGVVSDSRKRVVESVALDNDADMPSPHAWEKRQDPARIVALASEIIEGFTARHGDIGGIGVTGQMHGILYVDRDGEAAGPLYTWQDGRGNLPWSGGESYAGYLSALTGCRLASGYGLVTHFYNLANGLAPAAGARICTIMDYVVMKLAGRKTPVTEFSNAASLGFFDPAGLEFDRLALKKAGIGREILPELVGLRSHCGRYKGRIPVWPAIGDNQAAFIGSVGDIRRSVHVTVGTSSQISVWSPDFVSVPGLDTRPLPTGGYIVVGAALCGGAAFAVLKDFFAATLQMFGCDVPDTAGLYSRMTAQPYSVPDDPVVVRTLFNGTRAEPDKRGAIENISTDNFTPDGLIAGFVGGICRELYDFYRCLPPEIRDGKELIVGSGNGIRKNPLLGPALVEVFGKELILSPSVEEAAFGASLVAALNTNEN